MVAPFFRAKFDNMTEGQVINLTNHSAAINSGNTFNVYQGTIWTATQDSAIRGNRGAKVTSTAQAAWLDITLDAGTTIIGAMIGLTIPSSPVNPTSNVAILQFRSVGNGANLTNVLFTTGGILQLVHGGNGAALNFNSNTALPAGQYWLWVALEAGTTTNNGKLYARLINDADGTVINDYSNTAANTTANGTPSTAETIRIGKPSSSGNWTGYFDEIMAASSLSQIDIPEALGRWTTKKIVRFT